MPISVFLLLVQLITNFLSFFFFPLFVRSPAGPLVSTQRHAETIGYAPVNTDYHFNFFPFFSLSLLNIIIFLSFSFLFLGLFYLLSVSPMCVELQASLGCASKQAQSSSCQTRKVIYHLITHQYKNPQRNIKTTFCLLHFRFQ